MMLWCGVNLELYRVIVEMWNMHDYGWYGL